MALGPDERAALKAQIYEQYRNQPDTALYVGLELALRGLEISRKRLDSGVLEWSQYVRLKGHYNASAHGVLSIFEERGWNPEVVQLWKRFHGPLWMDLEEPLSLSSYVQDVYTKIIPKLTAPHMALRALHKSLGDWAKNQGDPRSANASRQSIEAITDAMDKVGHALQVRALKAIHGYDSKPDFTWMSRFLAAMATPISVEPESTVPVDMIETPRKRRGLQKSKPNDNFFETPQAADPAMMPTGIPVAAAWEDDVSASQPWEEALDIAPGSINVLPAVAEKPKPRGLQKCNPQNDVGIDSFGI